ncbi:MAG: hypothetical protein Q8O67_02885 [Deltaproteobacteria bacterium]|nr:hypothetical protein [Deltaproteobacteria bacterium]
MPTHSDVRRGYALMAVVVVTVLILSGASILLLIGKDSAITSIEEKRSTEAHGIAIAGIEWMLGNIASQGAKDQAVEVALSTTAGVNFIGAPTLAIPVGSKKIYRFDPSSKLGGVPTSPPAVGTSNADWTALGNGHFGLTVTIDPLDTRRSILIRSIGIVADKVLILESNLILNIVQTVPAGITGCFDAAFEVKFDDKEGPYDRIGNIRYNGGTGVPFALSSDHNRMNGLAREKDADEPSITGIDGTYIQGRKWRGLQSLRSNTGALGCLSGTQSVLCPAVTNRFGGTQTLNLRNDNVGPLALWEKNPYIANDPRIVDAFDGVAGGGPGGLRLGLDGFVFDSVPTTGFTTGTTVTDQRGFPIIAYEVHPTAQTNANGGFLIEPDWAGDKDAEAKRGFYACDSNASDGDTVCPGTPPVCPPGVSDGGDGHIECLVGKSDGTEASWTDGDVQAAGRAWGFIQSTLRQCTGSGDSIDVVTGSPWFHKTNNPNGVRCANGFQWLENVAACLIVPPNAARSAALSSNNPRDAFSSASPASSDANNFKGCHPGCLIATDVDLSGAITNEDRPFRSACINLASGLSTYGPGALPAKGAGRFDATYREGGVGTTQRWQKYNQDRTTNVTLLAEIIDGTTPAKFFPAGATSTQLLGGAVAERGNGSLITRLDMTDRGPLGSCEQNCLAYGWGRDQTWGAHRNGESVVFSTAAASSTVVIGTSTAATTSDRNCSALVPDFSGTGTAPSFVSETCNMDADLDGLMDRRSYALSSSYREECADPHDGMAWGPAFNISSGNTNLTGTGCSNRMPGMSADTAPTRLLPFCEDGNDTDLQEGVALLENLAVVVNSGEFNKTGLDNGAGWFGGARCHMGEDMGSFAANNGFPAVPDFNHSHAGAIASLNSNDLDRLGKPDYWMEDECPAPVVLRMDSNAEVNVKKVCGCGVLIITENSLRFSSGSHFLWRGVVIWNMKTAGKELQIRGSGDSSFIVEGAMLMTGKEGMQIRVDKDLTNNNIGNAAKGTVKMMFNLNPRAIEDAFTKIKLPVRTIRRIQ